MNSDLILAIVAMTVSLCALTCSLCLTHKVKKNEPTRCFVIENKASVIEDIAEALCERCKQSTGKNACQYEGTSDKYDCYRERRLEAECVYNKGYRRIKK